MKGMNPMIRMFNELKEDIQKQLSESQETMDKKNSRRHRSNQMNSKRVSTNLEMKLRRLF
jgi:hypothetical protein